MPPLETSPLLVRDAHSDFDSGSFPSVSAAILYLGDNLGPDSFADLYPRAGNICSEFAFRIVVLLELRARKLKQKPETDIWNSWENKDKDAREIDTLDGRAMNAWAVFLNEYRTAAEIEQVLWTSFPVSDDSSRQIRVVDLLNVDCPSQLICHDVVILSLANLWKQGSSGEAAARINSTSRIGSRYDALCTPRVLHFMELATHLSYFGLLVSYVMHPPYEPTISRAEFDYIGAREILLMVFSSSILIRPWTIFNVPFAFTLLTFLLSLPVVPFATGASFNILLLSFVFHAAQYHFTCPPSPLFLFKVQSSLPFAHFLAFGMYRVILPITLFFLPISILGTVWLSMALEETFFAPTSLFTLLPTPMQTRTTVLFMFFTLLAVILSSLFIFVVQGRSLDPDTSEWDSYSSQVGRAARTSFVRAVICYSSPYTFPAPFSLLQAVLISAPSFVVHRLGFQLSFERAEKILWRSTVAPVGLVCGLVVALLP